MFAFGALAIDVSLANYARGQNSDLADACTQAAGVAYRASGSETFARGVVAKVLKNNPILGREAKLETIQFGLWEDGAFEANSQDGTNAVHVRLEHRQDTVLGPIFGVKHTDSAANSTTAWQPVHVVLVTDITNSYSQQNFAYSRAAAVAFYDEFQRGAGPEDMIGMSVFTGQFGVEWTPMQTMDAAEAAGVRDDWLKMRTASKDGTYKEGDSGCSGTNDNRNFPKQCFPNMPREYKDENGTDHAVGLEMASIMLDEVDTYGAFNAAILMTDGNPAGTGAHKQRVDAGYREDRWRYVQAGRGLLSPGSAPAQGTRFSGDEVVDNTLKQASAMHARNNVNLWMISFVNHHERLSTAPTGRGYYVNTKDPNEIAPIYIDIARSLPMVVVE